MNPEYNRKKTIKPNGKNKIKVLVLLPCLITAAVIVHQLLSNPIKGRLLDSCYIKSNKGSELWILTDGSFKYTSTTSSPGRTSTSVEGLFCKTYMYIYDPIKKEIKKEIKTKYDDLPRDMHLYKYENKIWQWTTRKTTREKIVCYDIKTKKIDFNTKDFIKKFKKLQSGISTIQSWINPLTFKIETMDGLKLVYLVDKDKLISEDDFKLQNEKKDKKFSMETLNKAIDELTGRHNTDKKNTDNADTQENLLVNVLNSLRSDAENQYIRKDHAMAIVKAMGRVGSVEYRLFPEKFNSKRYCIYKITYSPEMVKRIMSSYHKWREESVKSTLSSAIYKNKYPNANRYPGYIKKINKVYIEAKILHKGQECKILLHQDKIGDIAERYISYLESGKEKWRIDSRSMFDEMKLTGKNPFAKYFFLKNQLKLEVHSDIVLLLLRGVGMKAFDIKNGKELWELEIN